MSDSDAGEAGTHRRWVVTVTALALVVRLLIGAWRGGDLLAEGNGLFYMHELAASLARGDGYAWHGVPNVFQQPGYVLLLAGGYAALGPTWPAVLAVNALLGTALVALTMRVARRLDPSSVPAAGLLAALHPVLVWHGLGVADTTLFSLALVGWLDAVLAEMDTPSWRQRAAGGAWVGIAFLTRPSLLPLLPVALLGLAAGKARWRGAAWTAVVWGALGLTITGPWMLRNHALTGSFPLIGTHGPESVWAANTDESPRATELDSTYDAVSALHAGSELDVRAFQVEVSPREAVRRERLFREETASWIRAHPGAFARMCVVRLGRMWDVRYHPTRRWERPLSGVRERTWVHAAAHGVVLLLALAGVAAIWRRGRRRRELVLVVAFLTTYSLAHCVGAGYSRVRVPVDPVLVAVAGSGLVLLTQRRGT